MLPGDKMSRNSSPQDDQLVPEHAYNLFYERAVQYFKAQSSSLIYGRPIGGANYVVSVVIFIRILSGISFSFCLSLFIC